jgi:hypothetical protein
VVAGELPRWQQGVHSLTYVVMSLLFGGLLLLSVRFLFPVKGVSPTKGQTASSVVMMGISGGVIAMQLRFRRNIIKQYSYDGRALRYSTLGSPATETRDLSEIEEIGEWRGRGNLLGYKLRFRDRKTVYLQYGATNSVAMALRIWKDLGGK